MSYEPNDSDPSPRPGPGKGETPPPRGMSTLFVWLLILGLAGAVILYTYSPGSGNDVSTNPSELETLLLKSPQDFKTAYIKDSTVYAELESHAVDKGQPSKFEIRLAGDPMLDRWDKLLQEKLPPPKDKADKGKGYQGIKPSVPWESMVLQILPWLLFGVLIYFLFFRQLKQSGMGGGVLNFGRTRARLIRRENSKTTFEDVAGMIEAKEEVLEIIEFLRNPKKFQRLGGRIPRGVLFIGPPGTGKTLLAKAIAGEAEVPFFSISGSDFVEMFVGVGASRVRDLFRQAKESSPCIIFLDEIDAVGRKRGAGFTGAHDEREQTLNAILVEMDGFETNDQVIIIAATNRPDVLDPALRRPGRFDREVMIGLPDIKERESILKVHSRHVKMVPNIDLGLVARGTPGFSGADLSALINEAALAATMHAKEAVDLSDLEEARDKVRWGRSRRSKVMDEMDKNITAYHEAGHTLLTVLLQPDAEPLHKVTIIPRGQALGATMFLPAKDRYTIRRRECLANIKVSFGGRIAEEMIFQDISSGAAQDIKSASELVRRMIKEWGMSDSMGPIYYSSGSESEEGFGPEMFGTREYSEDTAREIDEEIKRTLDDCYRQASELLIHNRDVLERLAKALLAFESLDAEEVRQIMAGGTIVRAVNAAVEAVGDATAAATETTPSAPPQA